MLKNYSSMLKDWLIPFFAVAVFMIFVGIAVTYAENSEKTPEGGAASSWQDLGLVGHPASSAFRVYRVEVDGKTFLVFAGADKIALYKCR